MESTGTFNHNSSLTFI